MKNKHHIAIVVTALALFASSFSHAQQSLAAVYREGVTLYGAGDYTEAMARFQKVLRASPRYAPARAYQAKCQLALKSGAGKKSSLSGDLSKIIIPSVDFQQVPLGDALTYITQRTEQLTGGKTTPNIVFTGTVDQRDNALVTMKLTSVPVTTLLKYVGTQTRCKVQYDEHAIMVTPYDKASAASTSPAAVVKENNPFE